MTLEQARATLELRENFTSSELKRAYRDLLLVWHPDRFIDNSSLEAKATAKTQEINQAHALLKTALAKAETANVPSSNENNRTPGTESQRPSQNASPSPPDDSNRRGWHQTKDDKEFVRRNPGRALGNTGLISFIIFGLIFSAFGNVYNMDSGLYYIKLFFMLISILSFVLAITGLFLTCWDKD